MAIDREFHKQMAEVSAFLAWFSDEEIEQMLDGSPSLIETAKDLRRRESVLVRVSDAHDLLRWTQEHKESANAD